MSSYPEIHRSSCESLSSILSDCPSQLKQIESFAFDILFFVTILPFKVLIVAFGALPNYFWIFLAGCHSYPVFDHWQHLGESGRAIAFRGILRTNFGFRVLSDYLIDPWIFEEGSVPDGVDPIWTQISLRCDHPLSDIVKSMNGLESKESLKIEIENLLNLYSLSILPPIGFWYFDRVESVRGMKNCAIRFGR
jgi:hypothetical protein